jgi:ABC-type uncharacterized transport system ATPase subunit
MIEHEQNEIVLEAEGVTKRFPGVLANDDVHLKLHRGEILALLGENGAGKSTLMNIIYGLYHPDEGTIRLKGQEVRFTSPREAIHSGIGMVHQHFQLVNVMTVAENVVLGEEGTVAYHGREGSFSQLVLKWLPSILLFLLIALIGVSLGELKYAVGGLVIGAISGVMVAFPPVARFTWGIAWRVGLAFAALAIASQVEMVTRVGITAVALRHKVETVSEKRPKEMDGGYTVKAALVRDARIEFEWSKEYRDAVDAGTGINGVIESAKTQMEPYRDKGIPGWLIDAIDDVPPVAEALSVFLLLGLIGAHGIRSWRGFETAPRRLREVDLAVIGGLALVYTVLAWMNLDRVDTGPRVGLLALTALVLGVAVWRAFNHRYQTSSVESGSPSPFDGIMDTFLIVLANVTEISNERAAADRVRDLSRRYGLEVDPGVVIEKLPVGMQQRVEIIKALYRNAGILILDEPTAVLTPQEGRELFKIMRELAAQGVSIIFITHKLKEVFEVATHIVVMRDGRVVGTTTPDQATESSLAEMMVGREVILQVEKAEAHATEPVLIVRGVSAFDNRGAQALRDVSFEVCAGEVLGIAGVQGNGQTELVEALTGLRAPSGGSVRLLGTELQPDEQPEGGLWVRVAAFVIDMLIVAVLAYFFGYFVWYFGDKTLEGASTVTQIVAAALVYVALDALYFLGSWAAFGKTIGMAQFSLEIVDLHDHRPGVPRLVQRYLLFLVLRVPLLVPYLGSLVMARHDTMPRVWFDRALRLRVIKHERITPRRIKDIGTSHVPEDRQRYGLVRLYSVADNLVLNDYYERPFAKAPNAAELPGMLLRYLLLMGAIVGTLTVLAVHIWDQWLWTALLDLYDVPESMRHIGAGMTAAQKAALQSPYIISVLLLIGAELSFGAVAQLVTTRVLGIRQVRQWFARVGQAVWRPVRQALGVTGVPAAPHGGLLRDEQAIMQHASDLIQKYDIRTPSPTIDGGNLSGGNQQKLIVAREFSRRPRLLIAAQPTRGIDVGSIEFVHNQIVEQRDAGAAVLLVSAELDEIMALSDRIAVLYKGEIIDTLPAKDASREQLGLLMAGIKN